MRTIELTAHLQSLNRADGRSATAAAAYRACDRIVCEREGRVHDYRAKAGLEGTGMVAPVDAPAWAYDRSRLWNGAELRERNGARGANAGAWKKKALVAREVLFGFPAELSAAGRLALADRVARHLVEAHGVAVDWAIHAPGKLGDRRNHHCHMLFTTRRMTAAGLGAKTREWNVLEGGRRTVMALRATLAAMMNEALAAEGHGDSVLVEHRSLKARGIARPATKHQGPGRTNAYRQRRARERQAWERQERRDQAERHGQERGEQDRQQATRAELRRRDIDRREARAIAQVRPAPVEAVREQPGRLSRIMQAITGRDQSPAPAPPVRADHERTAGDFRATFQAERDRMAVEQQRDGKALDDRHQAEDRQLDRAAASRVEQDRSAEVMERRQQVEDRQHERTHDHDREHGRS